MAAISFAGAVALASSIAMGGCFGIYLPGISTDPCQEAADHLQECLGSSIGEPPPGDVQCEGPAICSSQCINAADCAQIKDIFNGMPTGASQALLDCLTKCSSAQ